MAPIMTRPAAVPPLPPPPPPAKLTATLSVGLTEQEKEQVRKLADDLDISMSKLARGWILRGLADGRP